MTVQTMTAAQRGTKHICAECACKYYDLGKSGAVCPKCGGAAAEKKLQSSGRPVKRSSRKSFG